ncbi:hypothetical protein [Nocardia asteroides]|uniref:hypothetical protein n=1 Tax=Nocardia asteroides TaxID=1824 RepID=UPI0033FDC8F9
MPVPNNPATRLANILQNLLSQSSNKAIGRSLRNVFGDPADAQFYVMLGELHALPAEVDRLVRVHADTEHHEVEDLLSWRAQVDAALSAAQNLGNPTHAVVNYIKSEDIKSLKFCGSVLSAANVEGRVDETVLAELRTQVDELYNEVQADSKIPADLRTFICNQLDRIRRALREFTIRGPQALNDALNEVAGAVVRNGNLVSDANEDSQSTWEKFRRVISLGEQVGNAVDALGKGAQSAALGWAAVWLVLNGVEPQQQLPPSPGTSIIDSAPAPAPSHGIEGGQ